MAHSFFASTLLPLALFVIMTGLGLTLRTEDFRRILVYPRGVFIGLSNLLVLSPLLAFGIASLFALPPELAVGLVLLGASPGGTTANLLTHLARGDTALSVTMTAISSLAAVITTPLFLALASAHFLGSEGAPTLDMPRIVIRVLFMTLVPLGLGMLIRARLPVLAQQAEPWVKRAAIAFLLLIIVGALYESRDRAAEMWVSVGVATLTLNLSAMTFSYLISRQARLDRRQSTAVAIELGVHNTALAMAVSAMIAPIYAVPAAVYSIVMLISGSAFVTLVQRRNAAEIQAPSNPDTARGQTGP